MTVLEEIALRQSILYGGLLLGLAAALIYAAGFCYRGPSWPRTVVKAVPLLAFAVAAQVNFANPLIVAALALSALGDIALSRAGDRAFLAGLVAFAGAHLAYALMFSGLLYGEDPARLLDVPLLPAAALVILASSTEFWLAPHAGALRGPVRIYVLLITLMGLTALSLPDGREIAVIGAFAFILSDFVLALQLFRMSSASRWQVPASVALWLLYVGGQAAILVGAGFARPLFQIG
jgi:uncharacterized membrane protein YhhN